MRPREGQWPTQSHAAHGWQVQEDRLDPLTLADLAGGPGTGAQGLRRVEQPLLFQAQLLFLSK